MTERSWAYDRYILDNDHRVVPASWSAWVRFMEDNVIPGSYHNYHCVAEHVTEHYRIFTQFTGRDDRMDENGPPLVFFTDVCERVETEYSFPDGTFVGPEYVDFAGEDILRYSSWEEAMAGHAAMIKRVEQMETDTGVALRTVTASGWESRE